MSERLIDFLYILARDHLTVGDIENIMWNHVDTAHSSYCHSYLEEYVRDLAERLTDDTVAITDWKHMFKDINGDKFFIDKDGNPVVEDSNG